MTRFSLLLLALMLLSGCETLNDTLVRYYYKDSGLSRRVRHQISDGLERREQRPPVTGPKSPAPPSFDQGFNRIQLGGDEGKVEIAAKGEQAEAVAVVRH